MNYFNVFRNYVNQLVGRNQEFEKLLQAKDIGAVIDSMSNRSELILDAIKDYDTFSHQIMKREDKIITDKNGNFLRKEPVWKLPVPYPVYINEISLVFLYGRPVKWSQLSENTDKAFNKYMDVIKMMVTLTYRYEFSQRARETTSMCAGTSSRTSFP